MVLVETPEQANFVVHYLQRAAAKIISNYLSWNDSVIRTE